MILGIVAQYGQVCRFCHLVMDVFVPSKQTNDGHRKNQEEVRGNPGKQRFIILELSAVASLSIYPKYLYMLI